MARGLACARMATANGGTVCVSRGSRDWPDIRTVSAEGRMRLVIATIAAACSIAVMIDTPRRELEEELRQQWQEYREHVGETTPAQ